MSPASKPKRILVVDDSPLMRRLITEIVESDPELRVVDTAENGRVALQTVRERAPDGVLLDSEMPELSGLDTLRRLRLRSAAKVVILSHLGHEGSRVRGQALRLGAAEVIDKPTAAVSPDLRRTRGRLILETLRRVLELPLANVVEEALPREGALASVSVAAVSVRGLAALCERVEASVLVARLNHELGLVEEALRHHGGIIDARVGGSVLAVFGVPRPRADHASHAVLAGRELLTTLAARPPGSPGNGVALELGVTIVTGLVLAGELGPPDARRYRTLGGALDQALRLARANEDYGADLIVDAPTLAALVPAPPSRRLDLVSLDADAAPVELHELPTTRAPGERALAAYARGLEHHEAGRFAEAAQAVAAALALAPNDRAAARLLARSRALTGSRGADDPA